MDAFNAFRALACAALIADDMEIRAAGANLRMHPGAKQFVSLDLISYTAHNNK